MFATLGLRQYLMIGGGIALALLAAWIWRIDSLRAHYKADRDEVRQEYATFRAEIQHRVTEKVQEFKEKANAAETAHEAELAGVRAATAEYIRTHRVRLEAPIHSGTATSPADTGVSEEVSTSSLVAVTDSDVQACGDLYAYAIAAHDWAREIAQ